MRNIYLWFSIALLLVSLFLNLSKKEVRNESVAAPLPTPYVFSEDKLWDRVQEWRKSENRKPYIKSDFACNVASQRLPDIIKNFSHDGFSAERFCNNNCYLGENLSTGYYTDEQILNAWLASESHHANLVASYTHSCIKCENMSCVHIFSYF